MDIAKTCIPDLSIQTSLIIENKESLDSSKLPAAVCSAETECSSVLMKTSVCSNITLNNNKESALGDISNYDDSFDVFVPLKNKSTKNKSSVADSSNSSIKGKQKPKVNNIRNRVCPYFKTKSVKQYFKPTSKSKEDEDLELAIARSLVDFSGSSETSSEINSEPEYKLKPKQNKEFKLENWNGKISKKKTKSILSRRTEDDRNRIITQKLAIILLENKDVDCCEVVGEDIELASYSLKELLDKNSFLWELSKKSIEDTDLSQFYVSSLKNFVTPRIPSPSKNLEEMDLPDDKSEDYKLEEINEMKINIVEVDNSSKSESPDISSQNNHSTLESLQILSNDWSNFYGSSKFTDIEVVLRDGILQCHKIVFAVRCPSIMKDVNALYNPHALDLSQYSLKAAKIFLKYIYSGRISDIDSLNKEEKEHIYILTKKYNLPYLQALAVPTPDYLVYDQSTCSPPNNSGGSVEDNNQGFDSNVQAGSPEKDLFDSVNFDVSQHKESNTTDFIQESAISPSFNNNRDCGGISRTNRYKRKSSCSEELTELKKPCSEKSNLLISEVVNIDLDSDGAKEKKQQNDFNCEKDNTSPNPAKTANDAMDSEDDDSLFDSIHYSFDMNELGNTATNDTVSKTSSANKDSLQDNSVSSNSNGGKQQLKTKSSLDAYFDTSFPSFDENLAGIGIVSSPKNVSTPKNISPSKTVSTPKNVFTPLSSKVVSNYGEGNVTPSNDIIIKDATPFADYNAMDSPILKNELSKYGLKQDIGRKKSKILLNYIYNQLHPSKSQLSTSPIPSTSRDSPSPIEIVDLDSDTS